MFKMFAARKERKLAQVAGRATEIRQGYLDAAFAHASEREWEDKRREDAGETAATLVVPHSFDGPPTDSSTRVENPREWAARTGLEDIRQTAKAHYDEHPAEYHELAVRAAEAENIQLDLR